MTTLESQHRAVLPKDPARLAAPVCFAVVVVSIGGHVLSLASPGAACMSRLIACS